MKMVPDMNRLKDLSARGLSTLSIEKRETKNRPVLTRLLIATAVPWLLAACSSSQPIEGTAIRNVTVIDAIYGVREDQTVVFSGDEILAVQSAGVPVNVTDNIDGTGKFLIPGLWDFHVHLTYDDRLTAAMPEMFLSWGITSVRDTGGLMEEILPVVEAMRSGGDLAPRVFFAGPLLDGQHVVYDGDGRPEIGISVPTVTAARELVTEMHEMGVNFIKIYEMVSPSVFYALVETATELNLPIDSHVPLSMRAREAGAHVNSIEHLRNIEMDCAANAAQLHWVRQQRLRNPEGIPGANLRASLHSLQRIPAIQNYDEAECDRVIAALHDTVMVPTLRLNSFMLSPAYQRDDWENALSRLPVSVQEEWSTQVRNRIGQPSGDSTFADWSLFLTGRMFDAGVPVGAGTDVPINLSIPGYSLHSELQMLVRAGLSPLDALAAATVVPADYFGLLDEMGSIEAGKVADMVLLDANPLVNIANSKQIHLVFSRGQAVQSID